MNCFAHIFYLVLILFVFFLASNSFIPKWASLLPRGHPDIQALAGWKNDRQTARATDCQSPDPPEPPLKLGSETARVQRVHKYLYRPGHGPATHKCQLQLTRHWRQLSVISWPSNVHDTLVSNSPTLSIFLPSLFLDSLAWQFRQIDIWPLGKMQVWRDRIGVRFVILSKL